MFDQTASGGVSFPFFWVGGWTFGIVNTLSCLGVERGARVAMLPFQMGIFPRFFVAEWKQES